MDQAVQIGHVFKNLTPYDVEYHKSIMTIIYQTFSVLNNTEFFDTEVDGSISWNATNDDLWVSLSYNCPYGVYLALCSLYGVELGIII